MELEILIGNCDIATKEWECRFCNLELWPDISTIIWEIGAGGFKAPICGLWCSLPTSVRKVWSFFWLVAKTTDAINLVFVFLLCDHYYTSWTSVYIHSLVQSIPVSNIIILYVSNLIYTSMCFVVVMQDAFSLPLKCQPITILMNCSIHTIWTYRLRVSCLECEDN